MLIEALLNLQVKRYIVKLPKSYFSKASSPKATLWFSKGEAKYGGALVILNDETSNCLKIAHNLEIISMPLSV